MTIEFSRRRFMASAGGTALTAFALPAALRKLPGDVPAEAIGRDFFTHPQAAVVQSLGDIAGGLCYPGAGNGCDGTPPGRTIPSLPGMGIALGGVGAGSFMLNDSGTFGPWNFGGSQYSNGEYQTRILPQSAFHVREQLAGGPATITTLATQGPQNVGSAGPVASRSWGDPLPAWNLLGQGQATYAALYPFGWISYGAFKTDVSMRFYSPIVAGEDRRTSLPLAYFDLRIANHTDTTADVSVMFTWPNAAESVDGAAPTVRTGLSNSASTDRRTEVTAVTMSADDPSNTPDAYASEWTIAARPGAGQTVSYVPSWDGGGDGSDIYDAFSLTGVLGGTQLDDSQSAGAVAVSATLRPGQATVISFALAWDFPQVTMNNNGTIWMRRYTEFYGARMTGPADASPGGYNTYIPGSYPFHQSRQIAIDALASADETLEAVQAWWAPLAVDQKVPAILRTAALNQLGQVPFKTSLWAAGFVSSTDSPTLGHRLGTGTPGTTVYVAPDSINGGNLSMGGDVDAYGYLAYNWFFPTVERDRLRAMAEAIMLDPSGDPSDPAANGDPYVAWQPGAVPVPGASDYLDIPSKRIYRMYAYATLNHDPAFLRQAYPAMKKELAWVQGMIPAGQILPVGAQPPGNTFLPLTNTYDVIPVKGADAYDSMLYLLALEVLIATGSRLDESRSVISQWRTQLSQAKAAFETTFWDPHNNWYKYTEYASGSAVLLDTFYAQHVAEQLGLPDLVDLSHYRAQLEGTYSIFMSHTDADGNLIGAYNLGLPPGVTTYPLIGYLFGSPETPTQEHMIWVGANCFAAATYINAGRRFGSRTLQADGIQMASAVENQIWGILDNGLAFDAPECWTIDGGVPNILYPGYERPIAIWDTFNALDPFFPPAVP
jgi:uncharacterized protein (DUF608 family)